MNCDNLHRIRLAALAGLFISTSTMAMPVTENLNDCNTAYMSGVSACSGLWTHANDKLSPTLTVNDLALFGGGWSFQARQNMPDSLSGTDIGLSVVGGLSGDWSVDPDAWDPYAEAMIVLKAANQFSAYLLSDPSQTAGAWDVSYWGHELSHLTVYVRGSGGTTVVPEPGTPMLIGLVLLLLIRRRG